MVRASAGLARGLGEAFQHSGGVSCVVPGDDARALAEGCICFLLEQKE
ncbi:hypothetical protein [Myxococcus xanthus]|uniref:Uncharacterized protein n=1 Tax=Myxococcus xanthus TaxID=34 RepID=A0A7Y4MUC4_MYXXA|nr:hypothetical protein [Myxococcus xanthus]NOJ83036.1 hypothetical protein [Myxococcus xanthus]NOJ90444.1 hypothetical protein [Myxococcus xanthus]